MLWIQCTHNHHSLHLSLLPGKFCLLLCQVLCNFKPLKWKDNYVSMVKIEFKVFVEMQSWWTHSHSTYIILTPTKLFVLHTYFNNYYLNIFVCVSCLIMDKTRQIMQYFIPIWSYWYKIIQFYTNIILLVRESCISFFPEAPICGS